MIYFVQYSQCSQCRSVSPLCNHHGEQITSTTRQLRVPSSPSQYYGASMPLQAQGGRHTDTANCAILHRDDSAASACKIHVQRDRSADQTSELSGLGVPISVPSSSPAACDGSWPNWPNGTRPRRPGLTTFKLTPGFKKHRSAENWQKHSCFEIRVSYHHNGEEKK